MPALPGGRLTPIGTEACTGVEVSRADEKGRARLVYGSVRESHLQLWKADLKDLEHGFPFAPSSRSDTFPAFSPDGSSVVFRSTRSGAPAAWIVDQVVRSSIALQTCSRLAVSNGRRMAAKSCLARLVRVWRLCP